MNSYDECSAIIELDLDPIKVKLMHTQSGEGWTLAQANGAETEYRRFLYLTKKFPNETITPAFDVDIFWHYHILDTMKYAQDCQEIFGYFLHHFPYVGMRGEFDLVAQQEMDERTNALYEETFGERFCAQPAAATDQTRAAPAAAGFCSATTTPVFCSVTTTAHSPGTTRQAFCSVTAQKAFCSASAKTAFCSVTAKPAFCSVTAKQAFCSVTAKQAFCSATAKQAFCSLPAKTACSPDTTGDATSASIMRTAFCSVTASSASCPESAKSAFSSRPRGTDFFLTRLRLEKERIAA